MEDNLQVKTKRTKRQKLAPWLLGLMVLAAGAVATWAAFGTSVGRADLLWRLLVWLATFLLSLYAISLLFGVIGWYVALLSAITGLAAVLAGHITHNDYTYYSGWILLIIAAVLGCLALLFRAYIRYR